MKKGNFKLLALVGVALLTGFSSCRKDDNEKNKPGNNTGGVELTTPERYEFTRNGTSTVAYDGQTDRLNQVAEIKSMLVTADNGAVIHAQDLKDMYANINGNGGGHFTFTSSKQLKDKTFAIDQNYFEELFDSAATASLAGANNDSASNGVAGLAYRTGGKTILVDRNGREFTQIIEKGLMGATFYNQIVNSYLSDSKIGGQVNNTDMVAGKNYTQMEHHMDEAFGYFGAPVDFESNYTGNGNVQYWAKYSNTADDNLQMNDKLMTAYKRARAAITEKKPSIKDDEVVKIHNEFERLIAATAIHYANEAKAATVDGDRLHVLSECYAFTRALRYSNINHRKLSQNEVDDLLENKIGDNLWQTSETNLNLLINKLSSTYGLDAVKSQL